MGPLFGTSRYLKRRLSLVSKDRVIVLTSLEDVPMKIQMAFDGGVVILYDGVGTTPRILGGVAPKLTVAT